MDKNSSELRERPGAGNDLNEWLSYEIEPSNLANPPQPAMWGNGQVEVLAELGRSCVCDAVCFGFGVEGLDYQGEEHLIPAIYDAENGRKYFLRSSPSSTAQNITVIMRPDRLVWRYLFDNLEVRISLILRRLQPGYLFKVELIPDADNTTRNWYLYHELRGRNGSMLFSKDAESDLESGMIWCRGEHDCWEAIGSSIDAESINLGRDGDFAVDIMVKLQIPREANGEVAPLYLARAFGLSEDSARADLRMVLTAPEEAEVETEKWWNDYLNTVPFLDVPDEDFSKFFLWSWPNYMVNQIGMAAGNIPKGMNYINNANLNVKAWINSLDNVEAELINLLHDTQPARDLILFLLSETRKHGLLSTGYWNGSDSDYHYYVGLGYLCGLIHKFMLTTGELSLLDEDIGGFTVLERLENALEAQLKYRDKQTGLFYLECGDWEGTHLSRGMRPLLESEFRIRGGRGSYYVNCNATMWATLLVLADIEDISGNEDRGTEYRRSADELLDQIRRLMWKDNDGFYCDLDADGNFGEYLGIGGFMAGLFANPPYRPGGVATKEQAKKLADWCSHPDFASDFGVISLSRNSPYFDPTEEKGFNSAFDMHLCNQVPAGLYGHGCYEEAHRQLYKMYKRLGNNCGLGPRYRGESYNADTGEILPWRFPNYPAVFSALTSVVEGVFGFRWTKKYLLVEVNSPWPWAKLRNLTVRGSKLAIELTESGELVVNVNGEEVVRSTKNRAELSWDIFR